MRILRIAFILCIAAALAGACAKEQPERADIKIISTKTAKQVAAEAPPAPSAGGNVSLEIYTSGKRSVSLSSSGESAWSLAGSKGNLALSNSGGKYELTKDDSPIADGKLDGDKLKLKSTDGSVYLEIKFKPDKYKISDSEAEARWEIKLKEDKLKVYSGGAETGGIKFKTDTGKLKAKDPAGNEIAVSRDAGKLSAVVAPYLMDGLDDSRRDALALVLYALGK